MNSDSTQRFLGKAVYYDRSRPAYPKKIIKILRKETGFSRDSVVADVGSGTGLLTKLFLGNGNKVYGVEPNDDMRSVAERRLSKYKNFISVAGKAERTGLPAKHFDLITVGQAFHWFDPLAAKKEFTRILKKEGYVLILLYGQNEASDIKEDYKRIVEKYGRNPAHVGKTDKKAFDSFFGKGKYKKFEVTTSKYLNFEGLKSRFLSASYMPRSDEKGYKQMVNDIKHIFEKHERDGRVKIVYNITFYLGRFNDTKTIIN